MTLCHTLRVKNIKLKYSNYYKKCFKAKHCSLSAFFFALLVFFIPNKAFSQDYFILNHSNYLLNNNALQIELFFSFHELQELKRIVRSGTSINIHFTCDLFKDNFFFDDNMHTYKKAWQLRYETLSNEYILYNEKSLPKRSHDLENLLSTIIQKKSFSLNNIGILDKKNDYYLELHFNMQQATTPPWLETTLFFWTWDVANINYHIDLILD